MSGLLWGVLLKIVCYFNTQYFVHGQFKLSEQGHIIETAQDAIKDPYVLEFVGLPKLSVYSESDLEQALID